MFLIKPRYRRAARLFVCGLKRQLNPRRITPLTFLLWAALISDLAAPGWLIFHLGFTQLNVSAIASAVLAIALEDE